MLITKEQIVALLDHSRGLTFMVYSFPTPAFGRLAASHIGRYLLTRGLRWQDALSVDRIDTLIVQVVLSAQIAHLPLSCAGLDVTEDRKRPVSVLSISSSMGLAKETTRRRVGLLVERGTLVGGVRGFVVPANPSICGGPGCLASRDGHALFELFALMNRQGFLNLPAIRQHERLDWGLIGRAIVDFAARSLEGFAEQHRSVTSGSIWATIIVLNVAHLLSDTSLPEGYADRSAPLPDRYRRPASLRDIVREVRLPRDTVRRHVLSMQTRGAVAAVPGGVIVPSAALVTTEQLERSRLNIAHLRRLFEEVARLSPERTQRGLQDDPQDLMIDPA